MSRPRFGPPRTDFGPAPPGYIPGIGRGAMGFTTRSDVGPVASVGEQAIEAAALKAQQLQAKSEAAYSDANFDKFSGYNEQLFASAEYDAEDAEADAIYAEIEKRAAPKATGPKARQRELEAEQQAEQRKREKREQFADLTMDLSTMSEDQWASIPDVKDISRNNRFNRRDREKYTAVPESIGSLGISADDRVTAIDPNQEITAVAKARGAILARSLDRIGGSSGSLDASGYLSQLKAAPGAAADSSDLKRNRLLLRSVVQTNPNHAPGWIALARFERDIGQLSGARSVILEGCEKCPKHEDIWIEAANLHIGQANYSKSILAKAVDNLPHSEKVWLAAAQLEAETVKRKAVLRRALELIPNSVELWKKTIELEEPEEAKLLLARAVEIMPAALEFWLALAKLETYENARGVLNRARKALPNSRAIWIAAAKLEELRGGNAVNARLIIQKAVQSLEKHGAQIKREVWIKDALNAERTGANATAAAIVEFTIGSGIEEKEKKSQWPKDAQSAAEAGALHVARTILSICVQQFPSKLPIWLQFIQLEQRSGTLDSVVNLLQRASEAIPDADILWLMWAKEAWINRGSPAEARSILQKALQRNPNSEELWLAAVKTEIEEGEFDIARQFLTEARSKVHSGRVWMKAAKVERLLADGEDYSLFMAVCDQGTKLFPKTWKLPLMKAQVLEASGRVAEAREVMKKAIKDNPEAPIVASAAAELEARHDQPAGFSRARAILEAARSAKPGDEELWLASVRIELAQSEYHRRPGDAADVLLRSSAANQFLAKALQECPHSGRLWLLAITLTPRIARKTRCADAVRACPDDAFVYFALARACWAERKLALARDYFDKATKLAPDQGDFYAFWYVFERSHGEEASQAKVRALVKEKSPTRGQLWAPILKDPKWEREAVARARRAMNDSEGSKSKVKPLDPESILTLVCQQIQEIFPGERITQPIQSNVAAPNL